MIVLADTSAWSRFYRNDFVDTDPVVAALTNEISTRGVCTTGMVYLELLRGFTRSTTRETIEQHFDAVPFIEPTRTDYQGAADISLTCRRGGVQIDSVDALIAQICITNNLTLLTADTDFVHAARHVPLSLWTTT